MRAALVVFVASGICEYLPMPTVIFLGPLARVSIGDDTWPFVSLFRCAHYTHRDYTSPLSNSSWYSMEVYTHVPSICFVVPMCTLHP